MDFMDNSEKGSKKTGRAKYRQDLSGNHHFDYKDPLAMARFVGDGGKITPSRISKLSVAQQKRVAGAIKKARSLALLPNGMDAHDSFHRVEAVSPVPFEI
jgi:small subunit ribosomal protein S18